MTSINNLTCGEQLDTQYLDVGYATKFDQERGVVYLISGEACHQEILYSVAEADEMMI